MIGTKVAGRHAVRGTYLAALMGVGIFSGTSWGQNQAIDPVNISGSAASSSAPAPATQAVVPSNVPTPAASATPSVPSSQIAPTPSAAAPVAPVAVPSNPTPASAVPAPVATTPTPAAASNVASPAVPPAAPVTPSAVPPATVTATTASAPAPVTVAVTSAEAEGKAYPVTELKVDYLFPHPNLPTVEELLNTEVELGVVEGGYVAPRAGVQLVRLRLNQIGKGTVQKIYRSGIASLYGDILRFMNSKGIIGVFVVVNKNDIQIDERDPKRDKDARLVDGTEDQYKYTSLDIQVVTSVVKQIRTVSIGQNSTTARVDNPKDQVIKANSPLQPASDGATVRNDLLRKDVLDDYVLRLNRFTGRHVDVALSGTNKVGELNLDYLISEGRSWYAFAQISNTGTSQTADFRERFGYVNNELTGHDDSFRLDYSTAAFSKSHSIMGSYEVPFLQLDRLRYRIYANWNGYTASDVGQAQANFSGTQWLAGNELTLNIFQKRDFFIDAVGGFKGQGITSKTPNDRGEATFFEPYFGFKVERTSDITNTAGYLILTSYVTEARAEQINKLNRADAAKDPFVMQYHIDHSFFLEPLLTPDAFARGQSTLANEIGLSLHGQYGFGNRLIPQAEDIAGGLFSVRGYPESIVAGDSVVVGSLEYRLHVPRLFPIQNDPSKTPFLWDKSFRFSPQQAYSKPDWDFIIRAFLDSGVVMNGHSARVNQDFKTLREPDSLLVGAGLGFELQYRQNFNLRVDWGNALSPVHSATNDPKAKDLASPGDQRVHITATILY